MPLSGTTVPLPKTCDQSTGRARIAESLGKRFVSPTTAPRLCASLPNMATKSTILMDIQMPELDGTKPPGAFGLAASVRTS